MLQAQVFLNNTCDLDCHFCMNKHVKNPKSKYKFPDELDMMSVRSNTSAQTIAMIDFLIAAGVKRIELGTTIGEPLQHDYDALKNIFDYMECHPDIEYYFMYTNLLNLTEDHIKLFNTSKKFHIKISCYGTSQKQYHKLTQHDKYHQFLKKLKMLSSVDRTPKMKVLLAFRAPVRGAIGKGGVELMKRILSVSSGLTVTYEHTGQQFDWRKTVDHSTANKSKPNEHSGHCGMIYTDCGVLSNGDFTICAWLDVYGSGTLGNIYTHTPEEILINRERIIEEQNNKIFTGICKYCKLYVPGKSNNIADEGGWN